MINAKQSTNTLLKKITLRIFALADEQFFQIR